GAGALGAGGGPPLPAAAPIDAQITSAELDLVANLGALAVDGIVAGIQLVSSDPQRAQTLAAEILQSTRLRLSTADFIACPSCGRTQFDLQSTTAQITTRLRHLTGLKIAVMGCIVKC